MKVIVNCYEEKGDFLRDTPDYAEVYDSITEALRDKLKVIRKCRKTGDFIGFRIYNTLGELKHKLASETVTNKSIILRQMAS
jgi:hypothetical protein